MTELLYGVNTSFLEQLGKLRSYTIDTEQISVVSPTENQLFADTSGLCQLFTSFRSSTFFEQLTYFVDTCGNQLLCINVANTFDVNNLVIHNLKF